MDANIHKNARLKNTPTTNIKYILLASLKEEKLNHIKWICVNFFFPFLLLCTFLNIMTVDGRLAESQYTYLCMCCLYSIYILFMIKCCTCEQNEIYTTLYSIHREFVYLFYYLVCFFFTFFLVVVLLLLIILSFDCYILDGGKKLRTKLHWMDGWFSLYIHIYVFFSVLRVFLVLLYFIVVAVVVVVSEKGKKEIRFNLLERWLIIVIIINNTNTYEIEMRKKTTATNKYTKECRLSGERMCRNSK